MSIQFLPLNLFFSTVILYISSIVVGIGKATVERLAIEGATVAIFDINKTAREKLAAVSTSRGLKVFYYEVDVSDKDKCVEAVKSFVAVTSSVNYLINCAVYFGSKSLNAGKKDWDKSFGVNVIGYSNMVQACHPYMSKITGDKSILNLSSISGHRAQLNRWTYSSTKGAILALTKCMALDLSKDGIRVNSVSPAWVWTPEVAKAAEGDRAKWEPLWGPYHMTRKFAERSEIASAICFLLSEDASCITGTDLPVDGGYMAMGPEGLGEKTVFAGSDY